MRDPKRALGATVPLVVGVILGWTLATLQAPRLRADGGGPADEDVLVSGPVRIEHNDGLKIQVSHDAIYYLDYRAGKLLAAVPSLRQMPGKVSVFDSMAERDLVKDFGIAAGSAAPRFHVTTGNTGAMNGAWAQLYVVESNSRKVATYKVVPQMIGATERPKFELLEIRSFGPAVGAQAAAH